MGNSNNFMQKSLLTGFEEYHCMREESCRQPDKLQEVMSLESVMLWLISLKMEKIIGGVELEVYQTSAARGFIIHY